MTLYAVMKADLIPTHGQHSNIAQFFPNLKALANKNTLQAVILFSMLCTLVIWVFSAVSLILAIIFYITFLWHYIPQRDGRLSVYCLRKTTSDWRRLLSTRQPTLPQLGATPEMVKEDRLSDFQLARQDTSNTMATLPRYESRPPTRNGLERRPTLPDTAAGRPEMPGRMDTQGSGWSQANYDPEAPLLSNAGYAGQAGRGSPAPSLPPPAYASRQNSNASFGWPMPARTMT
ncbi:Potassium transporter [Elasticomyces elasticus]|nr:Potassium transporter [Elasticomyces elasticus]